MTTEFYASIHQIKGGLGVIKYKDGRRIKEKIAYRPYLFLEHSEGDYQTVFGTRVKKIEFPSIWDAREFTKKYENVEGFNIHGFNNWPYQYIYHNFKPNEYDRSLIRVAPLDIETDSEGSFPNVETADKEVTMITIGLFGKYHVLSLKDFDSSKHVDVKFYKCPDEKYLLRKFLEIWEYLGPDAVTGWNTRMFDIPYLIRRITRVLGEDFAKRLSPWGMIRERQVTTIFGTKTAYTIVGVADFDYMELYTKFTIPLKGRPERMSLDYICQQEIGAEKLDYRKEGYKSLDDLWKRNPQMYAEYNVRDVKLIDKLDDKMNLISIALAFAYRAGINYDDIFGTVRPWDVLIHRYLMDRKKVVPFQKITTKNFKIEGGHVKDPQCGKHRWVVSFDLTSLYPHVVMQWNIGPETFVRKIAGIRSDSIIDGSVNPAELLQPNEVLAGNGCVYRTDERSFMSAIMQMLFDERKLYKKAMLHAKQQKELTKDDEEILRWAFEQTKNDNFQHGTKIFLNGGYGAQANEHNRWFDPDNAEAITQSGQVAIKWIERAINKRLNALMKTSGKDFVIAIDTDSVYITLEMFVDAIFKDQSDKPKIIKFIDKFCEETLRPYIDQSFAELSKHLQAPMQAMDMKRECLADVGIWTGKKHYILNVHNNEGVQYDTPQKKIVGIEAVRSSTPGAARERIKQAIDLIIEGNQHAFHDFVEKSREEFNTLPVDEIAFPRGVQDLDKWRSNRDLFSKGTPIQAKASLIHNHLLKSLGVTEFPEIASGEKIKFAYVIEQNPYGIPCIAFSDTLPPQFQLDKFIDRRKQFEKAMVEPLKTIVSNIGWTPERTATLDAFIVD